MDQHHEHLIMRHHRQLITNLLQPAQLYLDPETEACLNLWRNVLLQAMEEEDFEYLQSSACESLCRLIEFPHSMVLRWVDRRKLNLTPPVTRPSRGNTKKGHTQSLQTYYLAEVDSHTGKIHYLNTPPVVAYNKYSALKMLLKGENIAHYPNHFAYRIEEDSAYDSQA